MQHTVKHHTAVKPKGTQMGFPLWALALGGIVFGAAALYIIIQNPAALPLAVVAGVFAVVARVGYGKVKSISQEQAEASTAVANTGLIIAAVAIAPLVAFALLWTALLLIIGAAWVLHAIGLA
jgi:hypothetical protein